MDSKIKAKLVQFLENGQYDLALSFVKAIEVTSSQRTKKQNDSMHVLFEHIAKELNEAGLSVQEVLAESTELDWTPFRVKENLWKKSLKKLYGKDSTTQMTKAKEIDNVYDHINRFLAKGFVRHDTGERVYIENIPFPSKGLDDLAGVRLGQHNNLKNEDYQDEVLEVKF